MDLERLGAVIRPRNRWEAMDLGVALARQWFLPLWGLWWLTAAGPALLFTLLATHQGDGWLLALWWLKPLFEAPLLAWLARALFGERLGAGAAFRRLPSAFPRRLWPYLLWRRFSMVRSFTMPVTLLEAQRGPARRARLRVLLADGTGAFWLTFLCAHLEAVLWLSALGLLWMMIPSQLPGPDLDSLVFAEPAWLDWLGTLVVLLAMSLVAPFYVAGGFALYLARRTDLEAWDLELAFRRAARPARRPGAAALSGLLLVALLGLGGMPVGPARADGADAAPGVPLADLGRDQARALIDEVLAEPDFGTREERPYWAYVGETDADEPSDIDLNWLPLELLRGLAQGLKWLLLIGIATLALLLARRLVLEWRNPLATRGARPAAVAAVAIGAPGPVLLPADLQGTVQTLLAAGDTRAALALLYQAQILHLRGLGLAIPDSATEAECLAAAARAATPEEGAWLARLTGLWQRVAWAHHQVPVADVQALLAARPSPRVAADTP